MVKNMKTLKQSKEEMEMVKKKIDWIDEQVKQGKRRVLTAEEALGKYAKNLK